MFNLDINNKGETVISFKVYDPNRGSSMSLDYKALYHFIEDAKKYGIRLTNPTGSLTVGGDSYEKYEIVVARHKATEDLLK